MSENNEKIPSERLQAVVFDFDGTLAELHIDFDRMRRSIVALAEVFLGEAPHPDGQPILEWLDILSGEIGEFDPDLGREFHTRARLTITAMELDAARKGRVFPFAADVLGELRRGGVKTAVITRNCTAAVRGVFPDVKAHCDVFLARDDVPRVKPDPVHLLTALEHLGVGREQVLMVGDHPIDISTARRAGTLSAAVASGRLSREELAAASPDYLAGDCRELLDMLRANGLV